MAKGYRSTSKIQHGDDEGNLHVFEVGDVVTGLTKEQMAALWEAGSLEEAEVPDPAPTASEPASSTSPTSTGTSSGGGNTEGTPTA